jgi:PBP1b-binding outer membrane lipoprotein LpoB
MKRLALITLAALVLTACSFETSMCPSYGGISRKTKYGSKAQAKYARAKKGI